MTPNPRIALYLDVENLLHDCADDPEGCARELERIIDEVAGEGDLVQRVAIGNRHLIATLVPALSSTGVRGFTHRGGPDAADERLLQRLRTDIPRGVDTVVIGSGDHCFAETARSLREQGHRVVVIARWGCLSHELYRAADEVRIVA